MKKNIIVCYGTRNSVSSDIRVSPSGLKNEAQLSFFFFLTHLKMSF